MMSINMAAGSLGGTIAGAIGGLVLTLYGYSVLTIILGGLSVVASLIFHFFTVDPTHSS